MQFESNNQYSYGPQVINCDAVLASKLALKTHPLTQVVLTRIPKLVTNLELVC
jgi:hypothetical protein